MVVTRGAGTTSRAVKKSSRKAATRRAPKIAPESTAANSSVDDLQAQLEVRTRERDEAQEQLA